MPAKAFILKSTPNNLGLFGIIKENKMIYNKLCKFDKIRGSVATDYSERSVATQAIRKVLCELSKWSVATYASRGSVATD